MCTILHEYKATLQPDRDSTVREQMRLKEAGKHLAAFSGPNSKYKQSLCYFNISEVVKLSLTLPWSNALQVQILYLEETPVNFGLKHVDLRAVCFSSPESYRVATHGLDSDAHMA